MKRLLGINYEQLLDLIEYLKLLEKQENEKEEKKKIRLNQAGGGRDEKMSKEEQKNYYSGKKKMHTLKSQVICLPKGEDIVDVVAGEPGPKADITIWRENASKFDEKQKFSGDKAYAGEPQIRTPKKKPKNGELTQEEKEKNKEISSERIFVEHLIRIIKIFKVMGERFRLKKEEYESVFLSVCGLVRLRMGTLIIKHRKKNETGKIIDVLLTHIFSSNLSFA